MGYTKLQINPWTKLGKKLFETKQKRKGDEGLQMIIKEYNKNALCVCVVLFRTILSPNFVTTKSRVPSVARLKENHIFVHDNGMEYWKVLVVGRCCFTPFWHPILSPPGNVWRVPLCSATHFGKLFVSRRKWRSFLHLVRNIRGHYNLNSNGHALRNICLSLKPQT